MDDETLYVFTWIGMFLLAIILGLFLGRSHQHVPAILGERTADSLRAGVIGVFVAGFVLPGMTVIAMAAFPDPLSHVTVPFIFIFGILVGIVGGGGMTLGYLAYFAVCYLQRRRVTTSE